MVLLRQVKILRAQIIENQGVTIGAGATVEDIAENIDAICDMSGASGR